MNVSLPRGTRDYGPGEAVLLQEIISTIEETFRRFAFSPLDTPGIERLETLAGKAYGAEADKEIYILEGGEEGLRYDFTVPLARYMAMNRDIAFPFKRYQIGKVWRMDEPQKMRAREFIQADIDIVGSAEAISDAEAIAAPALALERIGIKDYTILLSSRVILDAILKVFGIPAEKLAVAIRGIDKLEKIGRDEVAKLLIAAGAAAGKAEELLNFISEEQSNEERLAKVANAAPDAGEEARRLSALIGLLSQYGLSGKISVDFSLARGLDYYTGGVWEFVLMEEGRRLPSIASGGRYDGLMALYSKNSIPAVGTAIGVTRVFEVIGRRTFIKTYAKIHIAYIKEENLKYAMQTAVAMRSAGISVDLGLTKRALAKQLEYVNGMAIPYTAILGNKEREAGKIRLRNMINGEEEIIGVEEAIQKLRSA